MEILLLALLLLGVAVGLSVILVLLVQKLLQVRGEPITKEEASGAGSGEDVQKSAERQRFEKAAGPLFDKDTQYFLDWLKDVYVDKTPKPISVEDGENIRKFCRAMQPTTEAGQASPVFVVYANGQRRERPCDDAENYGPGSYFAAAVLRYMYDQGCACFSELMLDETQPKEMFSAGMTGRFTSCKAVIILQTNALYKCPNALAEIYTAQESKLPIIPLRCEDDIPAEDVMWPHIDKDCKDLEARVMLSKVLAGFCKLNSIPSPPYTIVEEPGVLDDMWDDLAGMIDGLHELRKLKGDEKKRLRVSKDAATIIGAVTMSARKSVPTNNAEPKEDVEQNNETQDAQKPKDRKSKVPESNEKKTKPEDRDSSSSFDFTTPTTGAAKPQGLQVGDRVVVIKNASTKGRTGTVKSGPEPAQGYRHKVEMDVADAKSKEKLYMPYELKLIKDGDPLEGEAQPKKTARKRGKHLEEAKEDPASLIGTTSSASPRNANNADNGACNEGVVAYSGTNNSSVEGTEADVMTVHMPNTIDAEISESRIRAAATEPGKAARAPKRKAKPDGKIGGQSQPLHKICPPKAHNGAKKSRTEPRIFDDKARDDKSPAATAPVIQTFKPKKSPSGRPLLQEVDGHATQLCRQKSLSKPRSYPEAPSPGLPKPVVGKNPSQFRQPRKRGKVDATEGGHHHENKDNNHNHKEHKSLAV